MGRKRPRRWVSAARRQILPKPQCCNESWSMDFMSAELYSGRPIRLVTIVDSYSRESLALKVSLRLSGADVVEVLNDLIGQRGIPHSPETWLAPDISKSVSPAFRLSIYKELAPDTPSSRRSEDLNPLTSPREAPDKLSLSILGIVISTIFVVPI